MTFIVSNKGVENTKGTTVRMGEAKIKIARDFKNEGKTEIHNTDLKIGRDLIQNGEFKVNDPKYFSQAVLELVKTAKNVAELGKGVLKLITKN